MGQPAPRVTVGIPVYNGAHHLPRTIESLLAQDYPDFELIISDNASDDSTHQLCQQYAAQDRRVKVHRNPKNLGASPNFSRLPDLARGEYFKWNGHSDWCAPQFLSRCVEALDADPSVVVAYPRTAIMDDAGNFDSYFDDLVDALSPDPVERYRNVFANLILTNMMFGLMRTEAVRKTERLPRYRWGQRVTVMQLALMGKFYEVPETLFFRRIPPPSPRNHRRFLDPASSRSGPPERLDLYYHYFKSLLSAEIATGAKLRLSGTLFSRLLLPREVRRRFPQLLSPPREETAID